jgi:TonB family protein
MRGTTAEHAPSWTLQYARFRSAAEVVAGDNASSASEGLTPPFPLTKEMPKLNSELIRTYLRNVVVVFAVMDTQGGLQRLSVRQSPDARLDASILMALAHWKFQPAQLKGQPIALKVLIGIPLLPYE